MKLFSESFGDAAFFDQKAAPGNCYFYQVVGLEDVLKRTARPDGVKMRAGVASGGFFR
ncbi:hypothetical protein K6L44_00355 [Gluconacetobacter entanii]|uniref:hypothetical protein n=1 Tax=Gluconacetobacter entanii TaxID=108528 RepID=UPI001C932D7D|nr:hypothetical protein [Gluconacetobacter entanii]MBY4638475.1 hypothetical protein [Gluconacetobacter entanii]MCW4581158.1 hypothetical protein [Gluconacetobacter entanii]MCW4584418.1 hypothetical protein [Gluconacetobacter entanii]MCW4587918.1 hypothetical protein [Gluconacetobacter entanii]